jgi:hypothetical protein
MGGGFCRDRPFGANGEHGVGECIGSSGQLNISFDLRHRSVGLYLESFGGDALKRYTC